MIKLQRTTDRVNSNGGQVLVGVLLDRIGFGRLADTIKVGSRKEGVGRTYRGYDGFAPMFAYIGTEAYMLLNELRPGTQHCQKGTPDFLRECLDAAEAVTRKPLLFRMDSGNDGVENLRILHDRAAYVINRNLRKETPEQWMETAKQYGTEHEPRPGKTVWTGSIWTTFIDDDGMKTPVRQVFRVVERSVLADGTALLFPRLDADVWYTNLESETEAQIIGLYCDHGTSEQYHSEFKGEIGLERLPCGDLAANKTVMLLGMVAYNILRRIGADALNCGARVPLRKEVSRRRIRKVIQDVIRIACKFVEISRQKFVRLASHNPWTPVLERLYHAYT